MAIATTVDNKLHQLPRKPEIEGPPESNKPSVVDMNPFPMAQASQSIDMVSHLVEHQEIDVLMFTFFPGKYSWIDAAKGNLQGNQAGDASKMFSS